MDVVFQDNRAQITLLRMVMIPLYRATAQYCPSLVHEHDIARESILLFEIPLWSTSHIPVKFEYTHITRQFVMHTSSGPVWKHKLDEHAVAGWMRCSKDDNNHFTAHCRLSASEIRDQHWPILSVEDYGYTLPTVQPTTHNTSAWLSHSWVNWFSWHGHSMAWWSNR